MTIDTFKKRDWRTKKGSIPTRFFEVGELCSYGKHDTSRILEIYESGCVYKIQNYGSRMVYGRPVEYDEEQIVIWHALHKTAIVLDTNFTKPNALQIQHSSRPISGLLDMVYTAGVEMDPIYQRDYVWDEHDKVTLINSIFNHVNLGLIVFARLAYEVDCPLYEIIDGKQRLAALIEFFEDRFAYNGIYYSQLSLVDKEQFDNYSISTGMLTNPTDKEKIATFLAVNTFGKRMDATQLAEVAALAAD